MNAGKGRVEQIIKMLKALALHAAALVTHTLDLYGNGTAPTALKKQFTSIWPGVTEFKEEDAYIIHVSDLFVSAELLAFEDSVT